MAQPVWVLSVDLQTKTATFQTGMADAARAARGSFTDIKDGARSMGAETSYSMMEARHGVMLLGEEFGIHLPRALTSFIASLGPIGAAMEAAFPFLAIAVGATLLLEHLAKIREEGEKLTESQVTFGTTAANVLTALDDKLLQTGIRTDELNGNHFAALEKELRLIDHQSFKELEHSLEELAKGADLTFAHLKTSWYQFSAGSDGAKNSLEQFKVQYDSLLSQRKDKEANDLLNEKVKREEEILRLQKQAQSSGKAIEGSGGTMPEEAMKFEQARAELKRAGSHYDEKAIEAQETLVSTLRDQVAAYQRIENIKKGEGNNAKQGTQNKVDADQDKRWREQADAQKRGLEEEERLREQNYRSALEKLQQSEREKIEATDKGSAARLAAIDAAIRNEERYGLQETGFYRGLLTSRIETAREMTEEQNKLAAEAGKEQAEHTLRMGELQIAAEKQQLQFRVSLHKMTAAQILAEELKISREEYQAKLAAYAQEIAALDKHGKDYENKLKAIQDKEKELTRQHENELTQIQQTATAKQLSVVTDAYNRIGQEIASTAARSITQGKNLGQAFEQMAGTMLQTALTNLMQMETIQGRKRFGDARTAAADAFEKAGNPILGGIEAAAAFAAVMAFEKGGIVPGIGNGDVVPAMLTPGEAVLPKRLTENLSRADSGNSGGDHYTVHVRPTYHIQTIDGDGMRAALNKHTDVLQKHFESAVRKMNR